MLWRYSREGLLTGSVWNRKERDVKDDSKVSAWKWKDELLVTEMGNLAGGRVGVGVRGHEFMFHQINLREGQTPKYR